MKVSIDCGYRPDLSTEALVEILKEGLGERFEVYKAGRLMVPDVIVKKSEREGAAVQILQKRFKKKTSIRVYGLAPSLAQRGWTPVGLYMQSKETKPVVEEVASLLKSCDQLHGDAA